MPTFVKETKYVDAHWKKQSTEYGVVTFTSETDDNSGDCDHYDSKKEALAVAARYYAETGLPVFVEKRVWTGRSWDNVTWDDYDGWGPQDTVVWRSPNFPFDRE